VEESVITKCDDLPQRSTKNLKSFEFENSKPLNRTAMAGTSQEKIGVVILAADTAQCSNEFWTDGL
jgi:hypothetical protein